MSYLLRGRHIASFVHTKNRKTFSNLLVVSDENLIIFVLSCRISVNVYMILFH